MTDRALIASTTGVSTTPAPALLGIDEVRFAIESIVSGFNPKIATVLQPLLESHAEYLRHPARLGQLTERCRTFHTRIEASFSERVLSTRSEILTQTIVLMLVHGNVKELVWTAGEKVRAGLVAAGIAPTLTMGIFSPDVAHRALQQVRELKDPTLSMAISQEVLYLTGHRLDSFGARPDLLGVYADQVVSAVRNCGAKRSENLGAAHPRAQDLRNILSALTMDVRGDVSFLWTDRGPTFLRGGQRAGDCTAPGGVNYWTNGAWNLTFENFEVESYHRKDFFCRMVGVVGLLDARPAVWIHAIEFTPLARTESASRLKAPALQQQLLAATADFVVDHFASHGIHDIILTRVSNCNGWVNLLSGMTNGRTAHTCGSFHLLSSLESAHRIADTVKEIPNREIDILLQGWGSRTHFPRQLHQSAGLDTGDTVSIGGKQVPRYVIDEAARSFMGVITSKFQQEFDRLIEFDSFDYRFALRRICLSENPGAAFDEMVANFYETARRLTHLLDPAAFERVEKDLKRAQAPLRRQRDAVLLKVSSPGIPACFDTVCEEARALLEAGRCRSKIPDRMLKDPFYDGKVPRRSLGGFWLTMPREPHESLEAFKKAWTESYFDTNVDPLSPLGQFRSRRPSSLKQIVEHFSPILKTYLSLRGVHAAQVLALAERIEPQLNQHLRSLLVAQGASPAIQELLVAHSEALVDYYLKESRQETTGRASLISPVSGYDLREIAGKEKLSLSRPSAAQGTSEPG